MKNINKIRQLVADELTDLELEKYELEHQIKIFNKRLTSIKLSLFNLNNQLLGTNHE